jgi:hypothetical protein
MSLFYNASNVKTVILPATFKAENLASDLHSAFPNTGMTIYYSGTEAEFIKLQEQFALSTTSPLNIGIIQATYNYISPCEAFYGGAHNVQTTIEYESFLATGTKIVGCVNKDCNENEKTDLPALFTCLGYSAPEDGDDGISIRYTVNSSAIEEYKEITGIELSYGLFATTKQAIGNSEIFDGEGNTVNGAIALDVTKSNFAFISLKMVGFDTEDSKKADFAIGAYVETTKNGEKKYSYLQKDAPLEGDKYAFIKYNDFIKTNS